ncbi:MAG TPA: glutaredoxin family protein [Smithellaceae bacterium]|jgi:glutaredoxin-like YruB-family protein|nr:glutaredoxin family protein [Smithellaceae bacterium]
MMRLVVLALFGLLLLTATAQAGFYQWEDEDGGVHITDYPPPAQADKKIKVHRFESSAPTVAEPPPAGLTEAAARQPDRLQKPEVVLYTTSWCPYCKKAKDFFRARGIAYTEYDIERDRSAAEDLRRLSAARSIPFAVVNGERISGYAPEAYEDALRKED